MQKILIATILLATFSFVLKAQNCPTASFTLTDSICGGNAISISNTSSGGTGSLSFNWDFCPGDLTQTPAYTALADFGNFAALTYGIDMVEDNGNWYGFTLNAGFAAVTRFDFGNSPKNAPTPVDLGNISGVMQGETDIAIMKENGLWYGFVCKFGGDIVRIDFGPNITNLAPSATLLSITPGFITNPFNMKMVKDHNNFKIVTANAGGSSVTVVDFNGSITNSSPSVSNIATSVPSISGITLARDCDHWYGFTVSRSSNDLYIIDFGDSITSSPLTVASTGALLNLNPAFEIEVVNDGGKWYGITLGYTLCRVNFGASLNNAAPLVDDLGIALNNNEANFTLEKLGSSWFGMITYAAGDASPDLRRIDFPDNCLSNISSSSDTNPLGVSYTGSGFMQVALQVTDINGNNSFFTDSVFINTSPIAQFAHSVACLGSPVDFTDSTSISGSVVTSWNWDFGDSFTSGVQNPSHSYGAVGNYPVVLVATSASGCSNSYTDTVSVRAVPAASFSFIDNSCASSPVSFMDLSTSSQDPINSWSWSFGDSTVDLSQNPAHSYSPGGTYFVELTVTTDKGCSSYYSDSIHIRPRPVPDFDIANTCIGETAVFYNQSTISDGSALTYAWDFGDFNTSTLINPTHSYAATVSVYDVNLISYSPNGCSDTITKQIRIGNQPIPSFSFSPLTVCKGNAISFTDLSTVPGGGIGDTINSWLWNFGDLTTTDLQNPTHSYADTGTYTITLTVSAPTACDSSVSQVVTVLDAPAAAFNYSSICFGNTNTFIDFSTAPQGSVITSKNWDFGDSTFASGSTVTHTYAQPGTYNVTLTVTDTFGCTDFVMNQVVIYPIPSASFTTSLGCTGSPTTFSNTSTLATTDSITNYFWNFGDGFTSTSINPTHTYTTPNTKTILLIATSSHGCVDSTFQLLFINPSPTPNFTFNQTCKGETTQFNYIANPFPSTINNYLWNFGDLGTSVFENPNHTYASANTYNVTVTVTDFTGCTASANIPVTVNPLPKADFTYISGCAGVPTSFLDNSSLATGVIASYLWNFGNGVTSALTNPTFIFDSAGTYIVHLSVISAAGCTDSVSKTVIIVDNPIAGFVMSSNVGAPPFQITYTNTSLGASTYIWDFGDGFTSNLENPVHIYQDTGSFQVTMYAFNAAGCSDTAYNTVNVLIPHLDLAVIGLKLLRQNDLLIIVADLFNLSNVVLNTFDISAQLEGGTIIHENYSKPFPPGTMQYTFNAKLETNENTNPGYICVETNNPNGLPDEVPGNDKQCIGNENSFQIIDIYHNPSTGYSIIHFNLEIADLVAINVYDISGKKIAGEITISGVSGLNTYEFDTRTFTKGAYTCVMKYREEYKNKKLLKF